MTRHRHINSIHGLVLSTLNFLVFALGTLKFAVLTLGTLASIALFCSCRSSDIATRESDTQNHMHEPVSLSCHLYAACHNAIDRLLHCLSPELSDTDF